MAHSDPWLRGKQNFHVEDHHLNGNRTEKVSHYFRPDTKEWDEGRVRQAFSNTDAEVVLQVRIPQNNSRDRLAWTETSDGCYTVKSGYHFWQARSNLHPPVAHSVGWKRLWTLNVPHKIKIFLWRFCKNTIPVRILLRHRGVAVTIMCPMCNVDVEHMVHVFSDCCFAKQCWQEAGIINDMTHNEYASDWLNSKLALDNQENLTKIAMVLWGIWFARNKKVWEEKLLTPKLAVELSMKHIQEWREAVRHVKGPDRSGSSTGRRDHAVKWQCPVEGQLKLNVDASVFPGSTSFTVGMVLRDHQGQFLRGRTRRVAGQVQAFEAEAVGMLEALSWIKNSTGQEVVVESDSLLVVEALQRGKEYQLEVGIVLKECQRILAEKSNVRIGHVRKLANKVAHLMARLPCELNSYNDFESPPLNVLETLVYDLRMF